MEKEVKMIKEKNNSKGKTAITKLQTAIIVLALVIVVIGSIYWYYTFFLPKGSIRIGMILPLTGDVATIGKDQKNGALMAIEEINKVGGILGRNLELVIEDDEGKPEVAISAVEKLINVDGIYIITGEYKSSCTIAVLSALMKYKDKVLAVLTGGGSTTIEEKYGNLTWFFHFHPWDYHYHSTDAKFYEELSEKVTPKLETIAIVYEDSSYGASHAKSAKEYFEKAGFRIVMYESFKSGTAPLTDLVSKAKALNPDIFYMLGYIGDDIVLMKNSKEINFNPRIFATGTISGGVPEFQESLGPLAEYVFGIEPWNEYVNFIVKPPFPYGNGKEWLDAYVKKYGEVPSYWAPITYVNVYAVAEAIKKAGSLDRNALIKALEEIEFYTPMGPLKFTKSKGGCIHQGFSNMIIFQWQQGKKVIVYPKEIATGEIKYPTPSWEER